MVNLKIVICDTEKTELAEYARICQTVCEQKQISADLEIFSDCDSFLLKMNNPKYRSAVDILIIDPTDGYDETVSVVRKLGYRWLIIYLSRSEDKKHLQQAFDNEAYNYCTKGNTERFSTVLSNAIKTVKREKYPSDGFAFSWELREKRCTDQLVDFAANA